jgi:pantoate--beta-alanine ligase
MEIIKNILDLNKAIKDFKNIGFVPTMGGIHAGHISLIKKSQKKCKKTLVTIFVNPTQFNDKADFKKYPRNLNNDVKILKKHKVDYLFIPSAREIYKKNTKKIKINNEDKILCAKKRKGHFEGVLNVMNRFFYLIKSKYVFMGEKDFQQLFLINKYLSNKYQIKIVNCPIIRDKNKLALSTRNVLLSKKNYFIATLIANYLSNSKKKLNRKKLSASLKVTIKKLENLYQIKIDYLEIRNEKNLQISNPNGKCRLFIAYYIGKIRLIDNFLL